MNTDIRRSLEERLPRFVQPVITRLTGLPASYETSKPQSERVAVGLAFAAFFIGSALGIAFVAIGGGALALLPIAWTVTIGAARHLQLSVYHHCAHGNVISERASLWIGRVIATMLLIDRFDEYAPKHRKWHHGRHSVSTIIDPTVAFLLDVLHIVPGAPVRENMRRFLLGLVSPRVHAVMLMARLASQFGKGASWANRLVSASYLVLLLGLVLALAGMNALLIGVLLPLTVGYQAAQIARFIVEHHWSAEQPTAGRRTPAQHDELTVAVRCMVPLPERCTAMSLVRWFGGVACNAWIRWTVLPGDSGPAHHWHHSQARGPWADYIAASAVWETARRAKGLPASAEAWGYREALRLSLESFAAAKAASLAAPTLRAYQLQET
jgi:hypothetical protein